MVYSLKYIISLVAASAVGASALSSAFQPAGQSYIGAGGGKMTKDQLEVAQAKIEAEQDEKRRWQAEIKAREAKILARAESELAQAKIEAETILAAQKTRIEQEKLRMEQEKLRMEQQQLRIEHKVKLEMEREREAKLERLRLFAQQQAEITGNRKEQNEKVAKASQARIAAARERCREAELEGLREDKEIERALQKMKMPDERTMEEKFRQKEKEVRLQQNKYGAKKNSQRAKEIREKLKLKQKLRQKDAKIEKLRFQSNTSDEYC